MKTKLMLMSVLTAACIFVFTGAVWADGKKDQRRKNPKQKHYTVSKQPQPNHHQNHWKEARRYRDRKHPHHKRSIRGTKYHRPGTHVWNYRHKPYYRNHYKHYPYHKRHRYIHRPLKKQLPNRYNRPIYSHTDGNVKILASTSRHGWSIKISSRD